MDAQEKKYRDIKSSTEFYKERQERYNSILEEREVVIDENGNLTLDKNQTATFNVPLVNSEEIITYIIWRLKGSK